MKRLYDLEIDEVSLVDRAANQHATVAIAKRHQEDDMPELYDAEGYEVDENELEHGDVVYDDDGTEYIYVEADGDGEYDEYDDGGYDDYADEGELAEVGKAGKKPPTAAMRRLYGNKRYPFRGTPSGQRSTRAVMAAERGGARAGAAIGRGLERASRGIERGAERTGRFVGEHFPRTVNTVSGSVTPRLSRAYQAPGQRIYRAAERAEAKGHRGRATAGYYASMPSLWAGAHPYYATGGGAAATAEVARRRHNRKGPMRKSMGDAVLEELSKALTQSDHDQVVAKAMDMVEVYKSQAEDAYDLAASLAEERELEAFTEVAKSYGLPVDDESLGETLYMISKSLPPEQVATLDRIFTAVGEQLYDELGTSGSGATSFVMDEVEAIANQAVGKSDGITPEQAITALFETNPAAYDEYIAETRQRY